MAGANRFLKEVFLPQHNARFATPAEDQGTAFVPFTGALNDILCIHEERTVSNDNTVRYKRLALQIPAGRHRRHYVKARVRVHEYPDGTMAVFHGPRCQARYHADGSTYRQPNPRGRVTRFDATDRRPVDKWTAAPRPTTSPQGQQPQQKRSTHMVHKPVNSECSRQIANVNRRVLAPPQLTQSRYLAQAPLQRGFSWRTQTIPNCEIQCD